MYVELGSLDPPADPRIAASGWSIYFNRGLVSTQAVAQSLPKSKAGLQNTSVLKKRIADPKDPLRVRLMGGL
jgi:hypothetical protein